MQRVFVVCGPAGTGKSYLANMLFGSAFAANASSRHVTTAQAEYEMANGDIVVDTVGFDDNATNFPNLAKFENRKMVVIYLNNSVRVDPPLEKVAAALRVAPCNINVYNFFCGDNLPAKSALPFVQVHKYQRAQEHLQNNMFVVSAAVFHSNLSSCVMLRQSFTFQPTPPAPAASTAPAPAASTAAAASAYHAPIVSEPHAVAAPWKPVFSCIATQKDTRVSELQLMRTAVSQLTNAEIKKYRTFGEAILRLLAEFRVLWESTWDLARVQNSLTNERMTSYLKSLLGETSLRALLQKLYPNQAQAIDELGVEKTADVFEAVVGMTFFKKQGRALTLAWRFLDW